MRVDDSAAMRYGSDVRGCAGAETNVRQEVANARVGSQPADIIPPGGSERRPVVAIVTDQFVPPHVSFVLWHEGGTSAGRGLGQSSVTLGAVLKNP